MPRQFERNTRGHDYVVGDLHGHFELLEQALDDVNFRPDRDRLFSVGDLIDRGPQSMRCLELVHEPWFNAVCGNHESMAQRALLEDQWGLWLLNGGDWSQQFETDELRQRLSDAIQKMPLAMEIDTVHGPVGIVHAEPPADWANIGEAPHELLLWSRQRVESRTVTPIANITAVVVGHTPVTAPLMLGNVRNIDLGSFFSGRICMERLDDIAAMV
ncbi:metallophosphoesterase [Kushneria aurantia]|uniref:Metallophosphoesterase n=1 Tax=Kushneria aurantia TaxID=504092 RepID=A0ABV6G4F5_9GAMM|nr:metallophosphoesterase [Kushneria aurantia]